MEIIQKIKEFLNDKITTFHLLEMKTTDFEKIKIKNGTAFVCKIHHVILPILPNNHDKCLACIKRTADLK